jgi:hypothetical protein
VRDAEVDHLHAAVGLDQHVLGFQIAMDDARVMGRGERRRDVSRDAACALRRKRTLRHRGAQRLSLHVFGCDEDVIVDLLERVDRRHRGV